MTDIKGKLFFAAFIICIIVFISVMWALKRDRTCSPVSAGSDLTRHPVYSTYRFEKDQSILNFGIQPLWIFEGNVAELMKRDLILRDRLRELGLAMRFHSFLKGEDINFFIRRGDLQGGLLGDMPTLTIASSMGMTIPALVDRGFSSIVADRFILVKDLKGMHVAYPSGSLSHYALLEEMLSEGLTERQVKLIPMDVTQIPKAFQEGRIDAFAAWEPAVSIGLKSRPGAAVIHRSQYLGFVVFTKDFANDHPDAVRQILASEIRAIKWMRSDSQHVRRSSAWAFQAGNVFTRKKVPMSYGQFGRIIDKSGELDLVPIIADEDLQKNGHLHREFEFLKTMGRIPRTRDWRDVESQFNRQIIKEILGHPMKYHFNEFDYEIGGQR